MQTLILTIYGSISFRRFIPSKVMEDTREVSAEKRKIMNVCNKVISWIKFLLTDKNIFISTKIGYNLNSFFN